MSIQQDAVKIKDDFEVKDPIKVFHEYSQTEISRLRETEREFDETIYQEAVALVLARLNASTQATEAKDGESS